MRNDTNPNDAYEQLIPVSTDVFDDKILPQLLFETTIVSTVATLIVHLYQIVCSIVLYFYIQQNKTFWRELIADYRRMKKNDVKKEKRMKTNSHRYQEQSWNILEIIIDSLFELFSIRLKRKIRSSFDKYCDEQEITPIRNMKKVTNYINRLDDDRHECRLCSIEYDINTYNYFKSVLCQIFYLVLHSCCEFSISNQFFLIEKSYFYSTIDNNSLDRHTNEL